MFANTYQSGYTLEVWDSRVNVQKNPLYKQLFKKTPSSIKNFYDKQVKSFIYQLDGNQKLNFPYDDRQQLSLHQRYIVLQIFIPIGASWSLQLGINDLNSIKKRINITTNSGKQQLKYFSFRYPLENGAIQRGVWSFLGIDIYSFCNVFKNTVFRSLDSICVGSTCKIRRIFTMKEWVEFQIPKNYWLAANIPQTMQLIQYKQSTTKQFKDLINNSNMINSSSPSSIHYSKMIESKVGLQNQNYSLRNSQKISPQQQKLTNSSKAVVKLPGVNNNRNLIRQKQFTPLKGSKLSQKVQFSKADLGRQFSLGKSNRSLTKADIIIQKSKFKLNSLQEKQQQIKNRLKSQQYRFTQKPAFIKQKEKYGKNQNIFKSDLFKSNLTQSQESKGKMHISPKQVKVKKKFQQDNIFREESYSSSLSRNTYKESFYTRNSNIKLNSIDQQAFIPTVNKQTNPKTLPLQSVANSLQNIQNNPNLSQSNFLKNKLPNKSSRIKQKQQIIEQDVWTDDQQQQINQKSRPSTPIQQMIISQQLIQNTKRQQERQQSTKQRQQSGKNVHVNKNKKEVQKGQKNKSEKQKQKIQQNERYHNSRLQQSSAQNAKSSIMLPLQPSSTDKPIANWQMKGQTVISKQNNKEVIIMQSMNTLDKDNKELQLIYDQMIGCYYHPGTNTYYEMRN